MQGLQSPPMPTLLAPCRTRLVRRLGPARPARHGNVVIAILKRQPEGPPSIRQALLVSETLLKSVALGKIRRRESPAYGQVEATGDWQKNARPDTKSSVPPLYTVVQSRLQTESRSCLSEAGHNHDW